MELLPSSSCRSTEAKKIGTLAFHLLLAVAMATAAAAPLPVALPGCPETCGNITVPYPFGTRQGCFREGFNLTCDENPPGRPPRLLVGDGSVEVVGISLADSTVRIHTKMLGVSLPWNSSSIWFGSWSAGVMDTGRFFVSTTHNRFVAMGCNLLASLVVHDAVDGDDYISVCTALCAGRSQSPGGDISCSGVGCCQTPVSASHLSYGIQISDLSFQFQTPGSSTSRFAALFIADQEWFVRNITVMQLEQYYYTEPHREPSIRF